MEEAPIAIKEDEEEDGRTEEGKEGTTNSDDVRGNGGEEIKGKKK